MRVLVIACTNEPHVIIDKCAQRFDIFLHIDYLDAFDRARLIQRELYANHIDYIDFDELKELAEASGRRSARNLERVVNTAVSRAAGGQVTYSELSQMLRVYGSDYNASVHKKCLKFSQENPFQWQLLM